MAKHPTPPVAHSAPEAFPAELPRGAEDFPVSVFTTAAQPAAPAAAPVPLPASVSMEIRPVVREGDIIAVTEGYAPQPLATGLPSMFGASPQQQTARAAVGRYHSLIIQQAAQLTTTLASMALQTDQLPDDAAHNAAADNLGLNLPAIRAMVADLKELAKKHGLVPPAAAEPCRTC